MRLRVGLLVLLVVVAFLLTLVPFLPATLIGSRLPPNVQLNNLSGTVWKGAADQLVVQGQPLGAVQWNMRPLELFRGRLAVDARLARGEELVQSNVALGTGGRMDLSQLKVSWSLAGLPVQALPPGWTGHLEVQAPIVEIRNHTPANIVGTIEVRDLREPPPSGVAMGSYRVTFDAASRQNDKLVGRIEDLEGPLQVSGTLTLSAGRNYVIDGLVAARSTAPPGIAERLRYLGTPDAQGRRPFSVAGTY